MRNKLRIVYGAYLGMLVFSTGSVFAQTNDQMVTMVKAMIQDFEKVTADNTETDEVILNSASVDPDLPISGKDIYAKVLREPENMFSFSEYQNGYTIIDDKEYPTNSIKLVFSFVSLPGFSVLNAWYDINSFEDSKGKKLLLSEKETEKYREYGIIEDGFYYNIPGEFFHENWLKRELENEENIQISGSIGLEYPSDYESVVLNKENTGELVSIGSIGIKLLEIDRNMITLIFKGNRKEIEGLQMVILNAEGKIFTSTSSNGIDANMYDMESKSVKMPSDNEIATSVENFDMSNMEIEQVKKIKVFGNIHQVLFLKVNSHEYLDIPFEISLPFVY